MYISCIYYVYKIYYKVLLHILSRHIDIYQSFWVYFDMLSRPGPSGPRCGDLRWFEVQREEFWKFDHGGSRQLRSSGHHRRCPYVWVASSSFPLKLLAFFPRDLDEQGTIDCSRAQWTKTRKALGTCWDFSSLWIRKVIWHRQMERGLIRNQQKRILELTIYLIQESTDSVE